MRFLMHNVEVLACLQFVMVFLDGSHVLVQDPLSRADEIEGRK